MRDIARLKTRNDAGDMVPIGSIATFRDESGPYRVPRYNLYPAAELQGAAAPGFSSGQAIAAMERIAAEVLPDGMSLRVDRARLPGDPGRQHRDLRLRASVVFVFLMLAALYESWLLPLAVILIVPMCLLAAVTGVLLRGLDNNILVQVGFIVLIGPRRQERHPDRRVRQAARGRAAPAASTPRSRPPAPACGRS